MLIAPRRAHLAGVLMVLAVTGWGVRPAASQGSPAAQTAGAFAHDPHYENKAIWPALDGKEYFTRQQWPKARLLVWAHPGQGERRGGPRLDDPANWLEDGKPARSLPDSETDVVLPDADKIYWVMGERGGFRLVCRHLTLGRNAILKAPGMVFEGNVWIKNRASIYNDGALGLRGNGHAFFRNDASDPNDQLGPTTKPVAYIHGVGPERVAQYLAFDKGAGSCEFIGYTTFLDEFRVHGGTLIVGPNARLQPGRNATPLIAAKATLAIMDGGFFGKWLNQFGTMTDLDVSGKIQGGLPDRPLTRADARLGLSFKNWQDIDFGFQRRSGVDRWRDLNNRVPGMIVAGGQLRTYTTDPARATLVIGWSGAQTQGDMLEGVLRNDAATAEKFARIPRKIDIVFTGEAMVDGVRFDDLHAGSLMFTDAAARAKWKNITFGPGSVSGEEAFQLYSGRLGRARNLSTGPQP